VGLNLEARVYQGSTLVRTLPMTAGASAYTASWDGRDASGAPVSIASYSVQVWHVGGSARYYRQRRLQVSAGVTSVTASPNPFAPTGSNSTTVHGASDAGSDRAGAAL